MFTGLETDLSYSFSVVTAHSETRCQQRVKIREADADIQREGSPAFRITLKPRNAESLMLRFTTKSLFAAVLLFCLAVTACYESEPLPQAPTVAVATSSATKQARPAGSRGRAELTLREAVSGQTSIVAGIGDTLTIEAVIDAGGDEITGVALFLSLDDDVLELVPHDVVQSEPRPFEKADYIPNGVVFHNDTLGDIVGDSAANALPLFQLRYFENAPASPFGPVVSATGIGVLTRFKVRVLANRSSAVVIDEVSKTGSDMGYFVSGKPGTNYAFRRIDAFQISPLPINPRIVEPTPDGETEIVITLLRLGKPMVGAELSVARGVDGRSLEYHPSVVSDESGSAQIGVAGGQSGYYTIRARADDGAVLGVWDSIPVNVGKRHILTFSIVP